MNQGFKEYKSEIKKSEEFKSANKYQKDLLYLNDLCVNSFPEIESSFPESLRNEVVDSLFELLSSSVDENLFNGYLRYYLSHYNNQHTTITGLHSNNIFPYSLYPSMNGWYLSNINNGYDSLLIGGKVIMLNSEPIENIEGRLFKYVFAENYVSRKNNIVELIRRPDLLKQFGIINQMDSIQVTFENDKSIWVKSVNKEENIKFYYKQFIQNPVTKYSDKNYNMSYYPKENFAYFQFNRCFDLIDAHETLSDYVKPWIVPFAKLYLNRLVKKKKIPKNDVGFKLDFDRPIFMDYLAQTFDSLRILGVNNLIIDLRNNGGGSSLLCLQLLYHLTQREDLKDFSKCFYVSDANKQLNKKEYTKFVKSFQFTNHKLPEKGKLYPNGFFNCDSLIFEQIENIKSPYYIPRDRSVFKGKIIVHANSGTGSAAALITTILQDNKLATIIGTSVGNNPIGATNYQPFKLPESKLIGSVATGYLIRPKPENGSILKPDYWIENSVSDIIKGNDKYLEKALDLINDNK
jgi:hypothetical protein